MNEGRLIEARNIEAKKNREMILDDIRWCYDGEEKKN